MYLSNRLTFSLFSVLLIAAFVFVATPAMAQTTVTAYQEVTAATAEVAGKIVVTLTYSENPNPVPALADFTAADGAISQPDDGDGERDVLTASYNDGTNDITAAVARDGMNVTLTITFPVNVTASLPGELRLKGYSTNLNTANDRTADPAAALIDLDLADGYIGGKTYVVYVRGTSLTQADIPIPVLPSSLMGTATGQISDAGATTADSQLVRTIDPTATTGNSNMAMPDLEEFFNVGGGTINLNVAGTAKDSRHLIINEIMWGVDNSRVGQVGYTNQQWIEVYNRLTTPVPAPTFEFIDDTFPAPATAAGTSDRISNIAGYQNVWNPPIKGSSGAATRNTDGTAIIGANPAFASIYRNPDKQNADGANAGHWTASNRPYFPGFNGTPGSANKRGGLPTGRPNPAAWAPNPTQVIINEVFNSSTAGRDWIELRNISTDGVNLENWQLTYTKSDFTETQIIKFPKRTIGAGEVLLIVSTDPVETDLIEGFDITKPATQQRRGYGPQKYLKVAALEISNDIGSGYLMLRTADDGKGHFGGRRRLHDVAGPARFGRNTLADTADVKEPGTDQYWKTQVWPINGQNHDKPNDIYLQEDRTFAPRTDKTWSRVGTNAGWKKNGGSLVGFVGGVGYDRGVEGPGTPGYHNDVVKDVVANLGGKLVISELMLTTDGGRYPQWIELHNTSKTHGINTADTDGDGAKKPWKIRFENHNSGKWKTARDDKTFVEFNLQDLFQYIPPNQTVLIVSDIARNSATTSKHHFPEHRVVSIWDLKKDDFLMADRRDIFLNAEGGFYIKITDANGAVSDEIGNLDGKEASIRNDVPYDDAFGWSWLGGSLEDAAGKTLSDTLASRNERTSLIRLKNADKTYRTGTPIRPVEDDPETDADETVAANETRGAVVPMGTPDDMFPMDAAWVYAVDTKLAKAQSTYYGTDTDHGTPGHTAGTPLPVELSFFRPTLEDGQVTIQWTTESELDNAGFNILRSDTRNGEFTQVNEQMIQGKGTTAQRSAYKWVDTTAKPGAVYYYQIEDVSFAGEHTTLATTKLKGLISAKGKLTTSWGDIKDASQ